MVLFLRMSVPIRKNTKSPILEQTLLWHITDRLDNHPASAHSKRVRHILELLIQVLENIGTLGALAPLAKLRPILDRYRFKYALGVGRTIRAGLGCAKANPSEDDLWEYGAVATLLKLIEEPGGLNRVRKCACGRLYFAEGRSDKTSCGNVCRQRKYDQDERRREEKRSYMRRRYAESKKHAANPKSGVGLRVRQRRPVPIKNPGEKSR